MSILVNLPRSLLDWLVPQTCLLCDAPSEHSICRPCQRDLPWLQQSCEICALPLPTAGICPQCQRKMPSFDRCIAAFRFSNPVGPLINQFKHRHNYRNGKMLCSALSDTLVKTMPDERPQCIVPIPLHWRRLIQRGFNQTVFISQEVSSVLKIPVMPLLRRTLATPKQQNLDRKTRLKNLHQAFAIKSQDSLPKHVALIDDVMTTGATAETASSTLKKAGVETVDVWVLARTPSPE